MKFLPDCVLLIIDLWIGVGIGAAVLCTAIIAAALIIKRRSVTSEANADETETGNELRERAELSAPKPSNSTEFRIDQPIRSSPAEYNEYELVDCGASNEPPYNNVSTDGLPKPENLYTNIGSIKN